MRLFYGMCDICMSFRATLFFELPYQWHIRLLQFDERADRCHHKLSAKVPSPLCKITTTTGSASSTRKSVGFSRRARRGSEKGERESSITIGNKSKADATIACRDCRGGWPVSQPPRGQYDCFRQVQSDTWARICPIVTFRRANFGFSFYCDDFFQSDNLILSRQHDTTNSFKCLKR